MERYQFQMSVDLFLSLSVMGSGTLERKTILLNVEDPEGRVLDADGRPQQGQVNGQQEQ